MHNIIELANEGLDNKSLFIAASYDEDKNVLSSLLIKEETSARTITIIQSTTYSQLVNYLDIDATISPRMSIVHYVLQALRGSIYDILSSRTENSEILEFIIKTKSYVVNKMLKNIEFPKEAIIAAIIR